MNQEDDLDIDSDRVSKQLNKYLEEFPKASITRKSNEIGKDLIEFLKQNSEGLCNYTEIAPLIDSLARYWIDNQNPKVAQYGIEALLIIAHAAVPKYKNCCGSVYHNVINKIGDHKEALRESARQYLIQTIDMGIHNPNFILEKLISLLNTPNKNLSTEAQKTIIDVLKLEKQSKLTPNVLHELCKIEVECLFGNNREDAAVVLRDLCERIGKNKVIEQLDKALPTASTHTQKKLRSLIEEFKFMHLEASSTSGSAAVTDEPDFLKLKPKKVPPLGAIPKQVKPKAAGSSMSTLGKSGTLPRAGGSRPKMTEGDKYALHSGPAGEADELWFLSAFEDVPTVLVSNRKEFETLMKKVSDDLKVESEYWEKKVDALRKLRAIIVNSCGYEDEIPPFIKSLSMDLATALIDGRSQVVREACLTFAFICRELKNRIDFHTCEVMLQHLMKNVKVSAKVVSTASYITLKFMFTYLTNGRLIGALVKTMDESKSREVHTAVCEFLELVLHMWPVERLQHQIQTLQDGIRKGITDSSSEARLAARRAYWLFNKYFPKDGEALLNSLDVVTKKSLLGSDKNKAASTPGQKSISSYSSMPRPTAVRQVPETPVRRQVPTKSQRSNSAIDLQAVQRAKTRQLYAAQARQKLGMGSLPKSTKKADLPLPSGPPSGSFGSERTGRTRIRVAGVSQSTPNSRSGSPSSRLGYHSYLPESNSLVYAGRQNVPSSQSTSREPSPNRYGSKSSLNNLFVQRRSSKLGRRRERDQPVVTSTYKSPQQVRPDWEGSTMAQRMLVQSLEAEHLPLNTEFNGSDLSDSIGLSRKSNYRPLEDHSDDSDASSLCSDRSFDFNRRTSDDISEIISSCESTSWSERKEGLVGLQAYLQGGNTLNPTELKRVTDNFTRMFMDSHTKVFSLFLDTLNELILVHQNDLNSWLYVLLTRLLNKLGSDLLGSIQNKILRSLDVVRESFPPELQMSSVLRFLTDPTQTPNLRVKTAALNFITKLAAITKPSDAFPPPSPGTTRDPVQAALHKMIGWTMGDSIKQGSELRRAAQDSILALFNLNTPQVTLRLANLPQEYQEAAATLLKGRVRRGSSSSGGGPTSSPSPPSPSARPSSALQCFRNHHFSPRPPEEPISPEEIFQVLRKTTAEIQNYTFETGSDKPPDKDTTTSKDSGISQLSCGVEDPMEEQPSHVTTVNANRMVTDCNGASADTTDTSTHAGEQTDEQEAMSKIVEALTSTSEGEGVDVVSPMSETEKRALLGKMTRIIREGSVTVLQENFKSILRILLGHLALDLNARDVQTRILVFASLTELVKKRAITEYFNNYVELLILKVLNCYKDPSKEVVRNAESCANTIAMTLHPQTMLRVLAPLMKAAEFPLNLAAIKMLTKLVECCGRDAVYNLLPEIMPGLIQAYDNPESTVRKSAVFCMVSLHATIGEEDLNPHLAALNGSKLKLLHLYIRRAQQGSSTPTSPRSQLHSSSTS